VVAATLRISEKFEFAMFKVVPMYEVRYNLNTYVVLFWLITAADIAYFVEPSPLELYKSKSESNMLSDPEQFVNKAEEEIPLVSI